MSNALSTNVNVNDTQLSQTFLTPDAVAAQLSRIQELMKRVMIKGVDYGTIPGCGDKPTLLKPGAEKICLMLNLATQVKCRRILMEKGHREYEVTCTLTHRSGGLIGEGVGVCSTMESKYRYRGSGRKCPKCGKDAIIKGKAEYGGGFICFAKKGGCGAKFADSDKSVSEQSDAKIENPDIADTFNTVKKMSKKRAFIDAVLTSTGASVMFTQDIEDLHGDPEAPEPQREPERPRQNDTPPKPRPRLINEDERQALRAKLAATGRPWEKLRDRLKLPTEATIEGMTEPWYLRAMELLNSVAPKPTTGDDIGHPELDKPQREPGDPDPEDIIGRAEINTLAKAMAAHQPQITMAQLVSRIGAAPGTTAEKMTHREFERAIELLAKKAG